MRRVARNVYGYRGKKAKRRRRVDPVQVLAFEARLRERVAAPEQQEESVCPA